ncbi:hypothetical protein JTE90_027782 [Oedothorax gibbosus]|uniref:Uncharacterized protein n=1 Tax=Oedothorax gibbosus TaxID=931172 RepID=A0AAV6V8S0_9ARAC|nr:hypothetical protein JTE90_027782 [Oedothorax gibbosus]
MLDSGPPGQQAMKRTPVACTPATPETSSTAKADRGMRMNWLTMPMLMPMDRLMLTCPTMLFQLCIFC